MSLGLLYLLYAPTLNGFWLGDDFGNLYRSWWLEREAQLGSGTLKFFIQPVDAVGAFYRPVMIASISISYLMFGTDYSGWALTNLVVHIANCWLIFLIVVRLSAWSGQPNGEAFALLASLIFMFNPVSVEAVVWVSARADGWVTLLSLIAAWYWFGNPDKNTSQSIWLFPGLLLIALGFKESAAILSIQLVLLAIIWPGGAGRARWLSLSFAFVLVAAFFLLRMEMFGNAVQVYKETRFTATGLGSVFHWWAALFSDQLVLSWLYLAGLSILLGIGLMNTASPSYKTGMALILCGAGLLLATLINLGGLADSGEGGRLVYGTLAWFSMGIGVLIQPLHSSFPNQSNTADQPTGIFVAIGTGTLVVVLSLVLLHAQLDKFSVAQQSNRALARTIAEFSETHSGLTMLIVPDTLGPVVSLRNAQGAIAMPPIQEMPLLHTMLPTLSTEIEDRPGQFQNGLAWQLTRLPPQNLSLETLSRLFDPAPAMLPARIACWNVNESDVKILVPELDETWRNPERWTGLKLLTDEMCFSSRR